MIKDIFDKIDEALTCLDDNDYFNEIVQQEDKICIKNNIKKIDDDAISKEIQLILDSLNPFKELLDIEISVREIVLLVKNK